MFTAMYRVSPHVGRVVRGILRERPCDGRLSMGMPNRQGRHAKQKQRKRIRFRGPGPTVRDEQLPASGVQPPGGAVSPDPAPSAGQAHAAAAQPAAGLTRGGAAPAAGAASAFAQPVSVTVADTDGFEPSAAARAEQLVSDALQAQLDGQHDVLARCAAELGRRPGKRGWQRAAERELLASLVRTVTAGWRQGWQPAEMVREIGRQFDARHARMAIDAAAMEMRNYARAAVDERWQAQLVALGASPWWSCDDRYLEQWRAREELSTEAAVTCALEVLFGLAALPRLGRVCPLPGTARQGTQVPGASRLGQPALGQPALGRARALLARAESAGLPDKAEILTCQAQELLAARSMQNGLLAAQAPHTREAAAGRRLFIDGPYEVAKAELLDVLATVNRCRAVWHRNLGLSTVLGFAGDLDAVELLFGSLLVQASTAMLDEGSVRDEPGPSRTRAFRQAFLGAYTQRLGERLADAAAAAERQAVAASPDSGLVPVLTARHRMVDEAIGRMFPELARHGLGQARDRQTWLPGFAAAYVA
jgi:hypothetical protein